MLHNIITGSRRQERLLLALSFIIFHLSFSVAPCVAQNIKIGGNVYGGGNAGDLNGSTKVTVYAGYLEDVYGGARIANVGGATFVNIDGEHASDDIFITNVFGGNDISGTIGEGEVVTTIPDELENVKRTTADASDKTKNAIDNTWKSFVHTSASAPMTVGTVTGDSKMIAIGSLFGGGNGDYTYGSKTTGDGESATTTYTATVGDNEVASSTTELKAPELSKAYIEVQGGLIAHVYGGGNNATVTEATTICIDNEGTDLQSTGIIYTFRKGGVDENTGSVDEEALRANLKTLQDKMHLTTFQTDLSSWAFNHARIYGGNNKAAMHIMPKWNLQRGIIRDVYSGGNEGPMYYENGILLEIDPSDANKDHLVINNAYGGCRRADVRPLKKNDQGIYDDVTAYSPEGYKFPVGLSARVIVRGGQITNVYGGNDISGKVYGGNALGIYSTILGDVYGGGNGSYAYTDNAELAKLDEYKDFYYNPTKVLQDADVTADSGMESVTALNLFRPNAEQVSIRLAGKVEGEGASQVITPTIIQGSVYVGGNSATLKNSKANPKVELKIGSHVIANNVFLGNNGENMVKTVKANGENDILGIMKGTYEGQAYSTLDLTNSATFAEYMKGCAMDLMPNVLFDNYQRDQYPDYVPYSTSIGSFYCGGNRGSMTKPGTYAIDFTHKVIIFDKLVGGSNNAFVKSTDYNASYEGGIIGDPDDETGNKLVLNLSGLKIQPKRWAVQRDPSTYQKVLDANGNPTYLLTDGTDGANPHRYLEWNTVDSREYDVATKTYAEMAAVTTGTGGTSTAADLARRLYGGNIYGGCCESGIVNGNVIINLNETTVERDVLFDKVAVDATFGEEDILYGETQTKDPEYTIEERRTGVILGRQGMDVFGSALNVFGGGKGKDTEIWGSTVVNLNAGYTFQIFGGSEEGVIGKPTDSSSANDYVYDKTAGTYSFNGKLYEKDTKYSCYVNLCGTKAGVSKAADQSEAMAECEFMYGGGFFGPICGNTVINMGNGRLFNSFAGSCNGDILGTAETFMGRQVKEAYRTAAPSSAIGNDVFEPGFPWVRDIVYGANDLGGRILGESSYKDHVRGQRSGDTDYTADFDIYGKVHPKDADGDGTPDVLQASAYVEYLQGRADAIFGGCYGTYDFSDSKFSRYTDSNGEPKMFGESTDPIFYKPWLNNAFVNFRPTYYNTNNVVNHVYGAGQGQSGEKNRDLMQNRSYVLIDIPQISGTSGASETSGTTGTTGTSEATESTESVNFNKYTAMEVFGAGAWGGVGMDADLLSGESPNLDKATAIIDLVRGDIGAAYGASYIEGVTRRTLVNVPRGSTIKIGSIFGGGYGTNTYLPCDAYEAHVEYHSGDACLVFNDNDSNPLKSLQKGAIFGGNNNERRTFYGIVNIDVPLRMSHPKYGMTTGYVYGAGCGGNTWSEYTEVNLNSGAQVYEVYGGGQAGKVHNAESVYKFMQTPAAAAKPTEGSDYYDTYKDYSADAWAKVWEDAWKIGGGLDPATDKEYWESTATNLANPLVRVAEMDDRDFSHLTAADQALVQNRYNANVLIHEGAYVGNYAYGGGYGADAVVAGTTYIALLGGEVKKDIYAAGTSGSVEDLHNAGVYTYNSSTGEGSRAGFEASANVYIKGGTCRNVYGGGWRGSVGHHAGAISNVANNTTDIDGQVHVVIGDPDGTSHTDGIPSITRNVYGGGEGGTIFGDAYVTLNKGYIGYRYNGALTDDTATELDERYVEELDDAVPGDNLLFNGGNVFGGGYVANSYVDRSHVKMLGGIVRGGLYGGGEIGPVGRGTVLASAVAAASSDNVWHNHSGSAQPAAIYKGGSTEVELYDGHVMRDVFGGGRGYDNWGGEGYMTEEEKLTMDRSSKGYVFGSTAVHIYGGEIGTDAGVLQGYGNVFGGGNEGFVYSATGKKVGSERSDEKLTNGVPSDGGGFYYTGGDKTKGLTLDCYVEIAPKCKLESGTLTFTEKKDDDDNVIVKSSYSAGEYVPAEALNQLKNWNNDGSKWAQLDTRGIVIHNALFAGGNITEGSDKLFANTTTVYGNAAASLRDVYNIDLITLGTEDMGGLYGDGNLTLVDGFRELHIDNYGTDYYSLNPTMALADYYNLTERQQAYYKLKYVANNDHPYEYYESKSLHVNAENGETYKKGQKITPATYATFTTDEEKAYWAQGSKTYQKDDQIEEGEYILMDSEEQALWTLFGVTSIYAGRPMNTIQRADMCGVFGSRMVLKGAQDRVPEAVDYTNYTINRVDEVSLNKRTSEAGDTGDGAVHGNYFGIYNVVNYLGNLTSDVFFTETDQANNGDAIRKTDSKEEANQADGITTYYQWKAARPHAKNRNNGQSHNKVALASGVYLEIKREEGEALGKDDWGDITGVIELDLINVMPGMGGGYVYARNEHGTKTWHPDYGKVTMLNENTAARTYRRFTYTDNGTSNVAIETSGNFVHNTKQIIDDCYPNGGLYKDHYVQSPAHYWFIRGQIYVYDQYISAFTGSANAYAEKVEMPLTISAAANGRMTLREVQPNYYAYYDKNGNKLGAEGSDERLIINNETYHLNDPVSYWTYRLMSEADKAKFVEDTYIVIDDCSVGGTSYAKGTVLTSQEYATLKGTGAAPAVTYTDEKGDEQTDGDFYYYFRQSNNISHNTGYVLTYDINNPMVWNNYHTKTSSPGQADKLDTDHYKALTTGQSDYTEGPTYTPKSGSNGVFGQETVKQGEIVYGKTYRDYEAMKSSHGSSLTGQATVTEPAYVMTKEYSVKDENGAEVQHLNAGTPIYQSKYTSDQWTALTTGTKPAAVAAKVCTALIEFSATDYVYAGQLLTAEDVAAIKTKVMEKNSYNSAQADEHLKAYIDDAYYCTAEGLYGGTYFETGKAYSAIESWCSMSAADRANFVYNYDALDLLVDPTYDGRLESNYGFKPQYDGYAPRTTEGTIKAVEAGTGTASAQHDGSTPLNPTIYSKTQPIDYQAECTEAVSYKDENNQTISWPANADQSGWLTREQYEDIPNEKHHYSPVIVTKPGNYYVVNTAFMRGDIPYTVGQTIDEDSYYSMTAEQRTNIDVLAFAESHTNKNEANEYVETYYYYCREDYTVNEKGEGRQVTTLGIKEGTTATTYTTGQTVPKGVIIAKGSADDAGSGYDYLTNKQTGFIIHGTSPTEVSTLYVSNESDINDLQKEKIITVIYLYEYEESDESGLNVNPVSERHIVNIHINFKSGVPEIGEIDPPAIVLPGTTLGLNIPTVTQGAYRVTESGWEVFENDNDAVTHYNGQEYINNETPVYWYQDNNYWIAYYAKTRLGKTYSNSVPISVANYHDLKKVMDDKEHHYYIDHKDVEREPKIYINDYSASSQNGLELFKDLIDLSHLDNTKVNTDPETGLITTIKDKEPAEDSPFKGHALLDNTHATKPMRGGKYLEFFLRADQSAPADASAPSGFATWTPIANGDDECFSGTLHGDGHTVSGLDHSLFNHLCGEVYNLGVTGTFSSAGVAETGSGYVENCWIKSSTVSGFAADKKAVFGSPDDDGYQHVVNCYYPVAPEVPVDPAVPDGPTAPLSPYYASGPAKPMPDKAFYNGEVAYDLNGFYLWKRYCDQTATTGADYRYFTYGSDNSLTLQPAKHYVSDPALCSSGYTPASPADGYVAPMYVEDRFADGDFIYVGSDGLGTIPDTPNERLYSWEEAGKENTAYYPIWPDDYIFFGQALNYGHMDGKNGRDLRTHQDLPSVINKSNDRVATTVEGNRVYRAPAYFRSSQMGVAHFNPAAVFAQSKKGDATTLAYKDMTAIDFTGYNDVGYTYQKGWTQWSQSSQKPQSDGKSADAYAFFPPLLDDGGLTDFYNADLTRNLLAYTMTTTAAARNTDGVVAGYLPDAAYAETAKAPANSIYSDTYRYHTVAARDTHADEIRGHRVQKQSDGSFLALNDHVLVDRQDFNAPIEYSFASEKRMWYQRIPDNYVDIEWADHDNDDSTPLVRTTKGWEGISLPFKAEIVTTHQKGELTHFYNSAVGGFAADIGNAGHEYWLRQFTGIDASNSTASVAAAALAYPDANSDDGPKDYTNTFLWDYYYSYNNNKRTGGNTTGEDQNNDEYQEDDANRDYYKYARTYSDYPRMADATPYIIGFPGSRYYEFDLSGTFEALTAQTVIPKLLERQAITFASKPGATTIEVSDNATGVKTNGYTFKPSYLNMTLESVKESEASTKAKSYALNADGNAYKAVTRADDATEGTGNVSVAAFRPYFTSEAGTSPSRQTRSIVFSQLQEEEKHVEPRLPGYISARPGRHKIVVSSTMEEAVTIRIVSPSGLCMATFDLQPGESRETHIVNAGVYIVQSSDGRYTRKLSVK